MQIENSLSDVNGIGYSTEEKLRNAGITSVIELANITAEKLSQFKGFGLASAQKLIESAKQLIDNKKHEFLDPEIDFQKQETLKTANEPSELKFSSKSPFLPHHQDNSYFGNLETPAGSNVDYLKEASIELENTNEIQSYNEPNIRYSTSVDEILARELNGLKLNQIPKNLNSNKSKKKNAHISSFHPELEDNIIKSTSELSEEEFEKQLYAGFNGEKLDKKEITILRQKIINLLKARFYHIIPKNTALLKAISNNLDLVACRIMRLNERISLILLFPIHISFLRGSLVVSEDSVIYRGTHHTIRTDYFSANQYLDNSLNAFVETQFDVFRSLIHGKDLFRYLNKLTEDSLTIAKTKGNKALYIHSNRMHYKIIIDPLLVCLSEPVLLEKAILFPYQRRNNLHIISSEMTESLVDYLEKKYSILESRTEQNILIKHQNFLCKLCSEVRIFSLPFFLFGILLLFIIFSSDMTFISTFTRLGIAAVSFYAVLLGFSYLKFFNARKEIMQEYNTPYFQIPPKLDETDLVIIKEELTTDVIDQLIYECFGKKNHVSIMAKIEQEKAEQLDLDLNMYPEDYSSLASTPYSPVAPNIEKDSLKKKIISKYSKFLEE